MNPINRASLVESVRRERLRLIEAYPELAFDKDALEDTLEGITDVGTVVERFMLIKEQAEADAEAMLNRIGKMRVRMEKLDEKAKKARSAAQAVMEDCGVRSVTAPSGTYFLSPSPPSVVITDEKAIPGRFFRVQETLTLNKNLIRDTIKAGETVPGCALSNAPMTIKVRT